MSDISPITDGGAAASVNPEVTGTATTTSTEPAIDDSGYLEGQTWEHDGFAIKAMLSDVDLDAKLVFLASELEGSQETHARQFRYQKSFRTLTAAQEAIDGIQQDVEANAGTIVITKHGANDAELKAQGWTPLQNALKLS